MKDYIFFGKSVLCALALYCFGSVTAVDRGKPCQNKVVIVGNLGKVALVKQITGKPVSSPEAAECEIATFRNEARDSVEALIWDTVYLKRTAGIRTGRLRNADLVLLTCAINKGHMKETFDDVNDELNYYFAEIDDKIKQKTMVIIRKEAEDVSEETEERYEAIRMWCQEKKLNYWDVSFVSGYGIPSVCTGIGEHLISSDPKKLSGFRQFLNRVFSWFD